MSVRETNGFFFSMMIRFVLLTSSLFGMSLCGIAQTTFLVDRTLLPPLTANVQEPRTGLRKEIGSSRLKIDIGSTIDVVRFQLSPEQSLSLGIDFFVYALSTGNEGLRLQIDAADGFFGGHAGYRSTGDGLDHFLRFRFLHLSAHFLDGHFDPIAGGWKGGRSPIAFTRDFAELVGGIDFSPGDAHLSVYAGFSYGVLVRPATIDKVEYLFGGELRWSEALGLLFGKPWNIYIADHAAVIGIPNNVTSNTIEAGVKLGSWDSRGLRVYSSFAVGLDVFHQYYDVYRQSWGFGFSYDIL